MVGIGSFLTDLSGGDLVIIDGDHGTVTIDPDERTLQRYQQEVEVHRAGEIQRAELCELPAETIDQEPVHLAANIEFPHEVQVSLRRDADGIGLYRTEFLYLASNQEPTEEEHYQAYAHVVRSMKQRPVVIRTLDLGADKTGQIPRGEEERNPFLGLGSIRLARQNLPLFRVQLRAILRASSLGPVQANDSGVLRLIERSIQAANDVRIPEVKRICRSVRISQCKEITDQAMSRKDAEQINQFSTRELRKIAPALVA